MTSHSFSNDNSLNKVTACYIVDYLKSKTLGNLKKNIFKKKVTRCLKKIICTLKMQSLVLT